MKEHVERVVLKEPNRQMLINYIEQRNGITGIQAEQIIKNLEENEILLIEPPKEFSDTENIVITMDFFYPIGHREIGSVKFGNVKLNMKSLVFYLAGLSTTIAGISIQNVVVFIGPLLLIFKETMDLMTISVTDDEAAVIYVLWRNCNDVHQIDKTAGYEAVNRYLEEKEDSPMERRTYDKCINSLVKLKSIEEIGENKIKLIEWISKDCFKDV